jgi:integrase/recombinase XerC
MNILEQYESFLLKEKRSSKHTVTAYIQDVDAFLSFAQIPYSFSGLAEVNYQLVRAWIVQLVSDGISNKSVNRKLSALRGMFKWVKQTNPEITNPMQRIKGLKVGKRIPEFVKESELDGGSAREEQEGEELNQQDVLIIELFYQTGMRLSELINLKHKDVQDGAVRVIGKRNKERIIPVSEKLFHALEAWEKEKMKTHPHTVYLFCTTKGLKLYPKFVYRLVNSYLTQRTTLKKKSPHVLRHTFATHMLNNGAGLESIKSILGHANLGATQIYTHNSFAQLAGIYRNAHPRGG